MLAAYQVSMCQFFGTYKLYGVKLKQYLFLTKFFKTFLHVLKLLYWILYTSSYNKYYITNTENIILCNKLDINNIWHF